MNKFCNRKVLLITISVLFFMASLSGCGFKMRGKVSLPAEMRSVFVKASSLPFTDQLEVQLSRSGVEMAKNEKSASAILKIHKITRKKRVQSVGSLGRVREFRLSIAVTFDVKTVDGKILVKRQTVTRNRDYAFDEGQVVGKSVEASIIQRELLRDIGSSVLQRIQYQLKARQLKQQSQ